MGQFISNISKDNIKDDVSMTTTLNMSINKSKTSKRIVLNLQKRDKSEILKERNKAYQFLSF